MREGQFDLGAVLVTPDLSESVFLATAGVAAQPSVQNGVHRSYRLPTVSLEGRSFIPVLFFTDGALTRLDLTYDAGGGSWGSDPIDTERAAQRDNAIWLSRTMGKPRRFAWGDAGSFFDKKGGVASIVVTFGRPQRRGLFQRLTGRRPT